MQNAKVQGNTKLCIFAFNFSPVPILPRENLAYANIIWKANYFLESILILILRKDFIKIWLYSLRLIKLCKSLRPPTSSTF